MHRTNRSRSTDAATPSPEVEQRGTEYAAHLSGKYVGTDLLLTPEIEAPDPQKATDAVSHNA